MLKAVLSCNLEQCIIGKIYKFDQIQVTIHNTFPTIDNIKPITWYTWNQQHIGYSSFVNISMQLTRIK